ncbi:hypothetical protein BJY52DRAFT_1343230, partial [Lactarius psammicola]
AASLDVNFKEELGAHRATVQGSLRSRAHRRSLQSFATFYSSSNPLLHPCLATNSHSQSHDYSSEPGSRGFRAKPDGSHASMNIKSPGLKSNMSGPPFACTFNTSANPNRQSLAFDLTSSFLSPDTANTVGNPSNTATTLAQQCTKLKAIGKAAHRISARALASSRERGTWTSVLGQVAERDKLPTQEIFVEPRSSSPQSTDFPGLSARSAFCSPRSDGSAAPAVDGQQQRRGPNS